MRHGIQWLTMGSVVLHSTAPLIYLSRGSRVVFFLLLVIKPCYEPVRFDFLTLIVNHSDFKVALHGISAHGAGTAFRIELACFFNAENQVLPFREA